jgi:hypothetical protein
MANYVRLPTQMEAHIKLNSYFQSVKVEMGLLQASAAEAENAGQVHHLAASLLREYHQEAAFRDPTTPQLRRRHRFSADHPHRSHPGCSTG